MKTYKILLMPDAKHDLKSIYRLILRRSQMPEVALAYIQRLEKTCYSLETAPIRGQERNDLRQNLRIVALDKNAVAAFEIDEDKQTVTILNIFYGGQDYEAILKTYE